MKIIALEGLDKSGKHSAQLALKAHYEAQGLRVFCKDYHDYDSKTGQLIRQWLYGEYPVDQATIELIMSADKMKDQSLFRLWQKENTFDVLLFDRYLDSQEVYAFANYVLAKKEEKESLLTTYQATCLLRSSYLVPDYVLYLEVTPEKSMKRKGQHGDNDRYESNKKLLTTVYALYEEKHQLNDHWIKINSNQSMEKMLEKVLAQAPKIMKGRNK